MVRVSRLEDDVRYLGYKRGSSGAMQQPLLVSARFMNKCAARTTQSAVDRVSETAHVSR